MPKQKKALTKEEKLAKDRVRKREKYLEIKNNPELYAIQKEKERKRYLLRKEKKKICSIKEMTPRDQREQRKRWRKNSRKYLEKRENQKKLASILLNTTPADSDTDLPIQNHNNIEPELDPLERIHDELSSMRNKAEIHCRQPVQVSGIIRKLRYKHQKVLKTLQEQIEKLKKEKKMLRRQVSLKIKQKVPVQDSIEKKVNDIITDVRSERVEEVKKNLLLSESLTRDFTEGYKTLKKKEKRDFADTVMKNKDRLKKYKVLNKIPFRLRKEIPQAKPNIIKKKIQEFFEEDNNSRLAAGKKECIKRKDITKQKRYLTISLKHLHEKFVKEQCPVSYSTFCKYRPFWVVFPNNERDTCMCKLHCNVDLLLKALKREKITTEASGSEMIKNLCCDSKDKCLNRTCEVCKNKVLNFMEFNNDRNVSYYQWLQQKQKYTDRTGKEKIKTVWTKKKIDDYPRNIIAKLDAIQTKYFNHCHAILMQYRTLRDLKRNLKNCELLIHIDFSENYCLKYHEEIQSFHFGGSRGQVSLHTGVLYYKNNEKGSLSSKSFCTISKNLNHDAGSVWAHLTPILKIAQELVPSLNAIHFMSDSPSSQYRNRYIFYLITKLKDQIQGLEKVTWNYLEAGHGKGAPDGVGAVIKRTADNFVKFGGDIGSFEAFTEIISEQVQNIHIEIVNDDEIAKERFPTNIPGFKGTMKVHQVVWCSSQPHIIALRNLSCFTCNDNYVPCSHGKHLGNSNFGTLSNETATSNQIIDGREEDNLLNDILNIDSPTLACNIDDANLQIDSSTLARNMDVLNNDEILNSPILTDNITPKVTILSDIRLSWQNLSFYKKPPRTFNPFDQSDFKNFLQGRSEELEKHPMSSFDVDHSALKDICENSNKENSFFDQSHNEFIKTSDTTDVMDVNEHHKISLNKENGTIMEIDEPQEEFTMKNSNADNLMDIDGKYNIGDWVIVEYKIKTKCSYFIGKIIEKIDSSEYKLHFLKKTQGFRSDTKFVWPINTDEDTVPESQIAQQLEAPQKNRRGQLIFTKLPSLNFK